MNEPENNPQISSPAPDAESASQELRRLINILFGAMILTSFTVTAYLGLQSKRASEEAAQAKAQVNELARAIQQEDSTIQATYSKLSEFARRHPDFQQILSKYRVNTTPPAK